MDFIERWFGVSPDGGDGTLELLYIVVGAIILAIVVGRWSFARRLRHRDSR